MVRGAGAKPLGADFTRLWAGQATSQLGSAVAGLTLPVVAVSTLEASVTSVALISLSAAACVCLVGLPLGRWVEFRHKRPVMVTADAVRAVAASALALGLATGVANVAWLWVFAAVSAIGQLAFVAASQANLVDLVSREHIAEANGRLQSTNWLALAVGPFVGVAVLGAAGPSLAFGLDAVTFLVSGVSVLAIRRREPTAPGRSGAGAWSEALQGFRWIVADAYFRWQLLWWVGFAGGVGLLSPLLSIWYLRVLDVGVAGYAAILGVGSVGGVLGALVAKRFSTQLGWTSCLRWAGLARVPGILVVPFLPHGAWGAVLGSAGYFCLLFASSVFNVTLTSYRQVRTPDEVIARVALAWQAVTVVSQPVMVGLGVAVASIWGLRAGLWLGVAIVVVASLVVALERASTSTTGKVAASEPS